MENGAAVVWLTITSAKRALLFCGGSRAGCKYISCRAGDTPASTETCGNRKICNLQLPHLHSMVLGGLVEISRTTRLTPWTSFRILDCNWRGVRA